MPATIDESPYVQNYIEILDDLKLDYMTVEWDRQQIYKNKEHARNRLIYQDNKQSVRRNLKDYYRYVRYLIKRVVKKSESKDKFIVFGIVLGGFLPRLCGEFRGRERLLDVRDYHKIIEIPFLRSCLARYSLTVVSSPRYADWLGYTRNVVLCHNISQTLLKRFYRNEPCNHGSLRKKSSDELIIACIGAIKDKESINLLLSTFGNEPNYRVNIHGFGVDNGSIKRLIESSCLANIRLLGPYSKSEEPHIYNESDVIYMVVSNSYLNNRTCLSNRLYNAALFGVPLLVNSGNFISEIVQDYSLGIVVDELSDFCEKKMIWSFDFDVFNKGRMAFLKTVSKDQENFRVAFVNFLERGS
ncbi:glycosyltransferase family protein [Pseudidiomarina salilacus]|uniref:hypothetical protein n=1 Tax=Pseudidiomarina salilacus TaxID=3384452 RepID=UPI003985601A